MTRALASLGIMESEIVGILGKDGSNTWVLAASTWGLEGRGEIKDGGEVRRKRDKASATGVAVRNVMIQIVLDII